jgi:hypothetical protein
MNEKPSKLNPALIGGAAIALLSTLPILNFGNCFCCMWVILGGALAAYLYSKSLPPSSEFTSGDGAFLGFLAGLFGALFGALLGLLFVSLLDINPGRDFLDAIMNAGDDFPDEFESYIEDFDRSGGVHPVFAMLGLTFTLIINSIFSTLGGLIAASLLRKMDNRGGNRSALDWRNDTNLLL